MGTDDDEIDRCEVVSQLLEAGDYQAAEEFALTVRAGWERGESLSVIARAFVANGDLDQAQRVWAEAIATARASEIAGDVQDSIDSSSVLWDIARDMALAGDTGQAFQVATGIKNDGKRKRAFETLAEIGKL